MLASICGFFEIFVNFLPLDNLYGVLNLGEKLFQGIAVEPVDPVFNSVNLDAVFSTNEYLSSLKVMKALLITSLVVRISLAIALASFVGTDNLNRVNLSTLAHIMSMTSSTLVARA